MSTIANLDVNVRGNASGLDKAVKGALGSLDKFKSGLTKFLDLGGVAGPAKELVASTMEKLGAGISKVQKTLSATASKVKNAAKSFHILKAGVNAVKGAIQALEGTLTGMLATGLAAFAGFVVGSREGASEIEELSKSAKDIGVTSEKLAGLQHAADIARVDVDTLRESLISMQVKLRDAGNSVSDVAIALSDIGIATKDIKDASPDEQFLRVAEALSKVSDQTERARLATQLLGEQGSRLLPMFEKGAAGIKDAMEEAKALGLTVTEAEVKQVQEGENAMNRMKKSFQGLFRTAAIALAPILKLVADAVTKAVTYINSYRDKIEKVFKVIEFVIANFGEYFDLYFDKALLKLISWGNDVEHFFIKVIPAAVMEEIKLIKPAFEVLVDVVAYAMVRITNMVTHTFTEVLPETIKAWPSILKAMVTFDTDSYTKILMELALKTQRKEGDIEKILRQDMARSWAKLQKDADKAAQKIGQSFKREMGPIEAVLSQDVARKEAALDAKLKKHLDEFEKQKEMSGSQYNKGLNPKLIEKIEHHDNAIAEKGSQEAFKIIAGANQDKVLKAAGERLVELKKQTKILEKILNAALKPGLRGANL